MLMGITIEVAEILTTRCIVIELLSCQIEKIIILLRVICLCSFSSLDSIWSLVYLNKSILVFFRLLLWNRKISLLFLTWINISIESVFRLVICSCLSSRLLVSNCYLLFEVNKILKLTKKYPKFMFSSMSFHYYYIFVRVYYVQINQLMFHFEMDRMI